ncbi:MAG: hypothetical protein NTZ38_02165 [Candidatus Taylorbacteria bacterium]|nr:hypothetical protein [Candidatus Taylorbacteria bacterium]
MDKSPDKEMIAFFVECLGGGGILLIIVEVIILKILEVFGVIKILI